MREKEEILFVAVETAILLFHWLWTEVKWQLEVSYQRQCHKLGLCGCDFVPTATSTGRQGEMEISLLHVGLKRPGGKDME